jgi:hypothetical protein
MSLLVLPKETVDTTSVWLTPEIVHFVVSKYFSRSSTYQSSPEHLHSFTLFHGLLRSLALCHTPPGHFPTLCHVPWPPLYTLYHFPS